MCVCQNMCNTVLMWRSENNLEESLLSSVGIYLGLLGLAVSSFTH